MSAAVRPPCLHAAAICQTALHGDPMPETKNTHTTHRSATLVTNQAPRTLASRLRELVQAAFSAIWIQTLEPTEALRELTALSRAESWRLGAWDCDRGMVFPLEPVQLPGTTDLQDPLAVIRALPQVSQGAGRVSNCCCKAASWQRSARGRRSRPGFWVSRKRGNHRLKSTFARSSQPP